MSAGGPLGMAIPCRWRRRPGREAGFVDAWSEATAALRARGSLGSRSHRGDDGLWSADAPWPDAAARDAAFATPLDGEVLARMREAVAESLPPVALAPLADQRLPAGGTS